jgi:hypothetical protein
MRTRPRAPRHAALLAPVLLLGTAVALCPLPCLADDFTYHPAGDLTPGSGTGREDDRTYVPGMRFPIEVAPAYANSQVWGRGGLNGGGGSQCDSVNYAYPWRDNYCESRTWDMPLCPSGTGHQGQDIRPSTCADAVHWAVAAEAGSVTYIGSYSLNLTADSGTLHRYLHMDPASIVVGVGDRVERGARLGRISDAFGDSSTSIHLHYDIQQSVAGVGFVFVPTYHSLVDSYEALIGAPGSTCEPFPAGEAVIDNQSPCFVQHGPPSTWRYVVGAGWDDDLLWTYAWAGDASNWAEWVFELEEAGEYEVSVYVTPEYAQAREARYSVRHAGGEDELRVDVSAAEGWLVLGSWELAAGVPQRVAVYDGPGEDVALQRRVIADAVRLVPAGGDGPGGGDDSEGGGDDAGRPDAGSGRDAGDAGGPDAGLDAAADAGGDSGRRDTGDAGGAPDGGGDGGGGGGRGDGGDPRGEDDPGAGATQAVTVGGGCSASGRAPASPGAAAAWLSALGACLIVGRRRRPGRGEGPVAAQRRSAR